MGAQEARQEAFVGRVWELQQLARAVSAARAGHGTVVLIGGEPGIGKTRLTREAAARARQSGVATVTGACWEGSDAPAYWPWMQIVRALQATVSPAGHASLDRRALALFVPEISDQPPIDTSDHGAMRARLFDAVGFLLMTVAEPAGLLVVVEDLHWADEASLLLLRHLAVTLAEHKVVLAVTFRDADVAVDGRRAPHLGALARLGTSIPLAGLGVDDLGTLVTTVTPAEVSDRSVALLASSTGGNPFFVLELLRLGVARGVDPDRALTAIPRTVIDVIGSRVARLPHLVSDVLQLATVVGERFDVADLRPLGLREAEIAEALDLAAMAGLVRIGDGDFEFSHDLVRTSIYESLGPAARARLHLLLGEALETREVRPPAEALARHYLAAAAVAGPGRGVRWAVAAGEHALSRFAHEDALAWFDRALGVRGEPDERDRVAAHIGRAEARRRSGLTDLARTDLESAMAGGRALGDAVLFARAALGVQRLGSVSGEVAVAVDLLEEAARTLSSGDVDLRAEVLAALASELYDHAFDRWPEAVHQSAEALALAERASDPRTLARCLEARYVVLWRPDRAAERVEVATRMRDATRRAGDLELQAVSALLEATARLEVADADALQVLDDFLSLTGRLRVPSLDYLAITRRAAVAILGGRTDEADELLARAEVVGARIGVPDVPAVRAYQRWEQARFSGRQHLDPGDFPPPTRHTTLYGWLWEPLIHLDAGRVTNATEAFGRATDVPLEAVRQDWIFLHGVADLADAALRLDRIDVATRCYEILRPFAGMTIVVSALVCFGGAVDHHLGRLALALGDAQAAAVHLEGAAAIHRRLGAVPWLAATEALLAQTHPQTRRQVLANGVMVRHGDVWRLVWAGAEAHVPDAKGVRDLAAVVARPHHDVASAVLYAGGSAGAVSVAEASAQGDDVLDEAAKQAYRRRLAQLDDEIDDARSTADVGRLDRVERERDALVDELRRSFDIKGRPRRIGDRGERARKAVSARIKDAIARIEAVHPAMGEHLRTSVHTGTYCSYRPPAPVDWDVRQI